VVEEGYRKHFGLSWHQLMVEPADAIWEWALIQNCRMKQEELQQKLHQR
jgi:hypothetical protein